MAIYFLKCLSMRLHRKPEKLNPALASNVTKLRKKEKLFGTFDLMMWVGKEQVAAQVELVTLFWSPPPSLKGPRPPSNLASAPPRVWGGEWDLHLHIVDTWYLNMMYGISQRTKVLQAHYWPSTTTNCTDWLSHASEWVKNAFISSPSLSWCLGKEAVGLPTDQLACPGLAVRTLCLLSTSY